MKINKHIFSIVFLAVAAIALSLPSTASAQITPQQCMDNYSGGICKDDPWFGSACGSDETDRGACTLSGTKCCSKISNMTQLTRDQCQANAGSNCVQGSCPSGSTTLGVCSDVANYLCCSNAYTNPINPGPSTGGASTLNKGPFNYQLLEKIPGGENAGSDLETYVENIYRIALIIVTLSAVLMLSIGGFMYLTSAGNTSAMGSAKSVIFDSLIGLVIAIVAWLILNVINPDLVNVTLNGFSTTPVSSGTPGTGTPGTGSTPGAGTTAPASCPSPAQPVAACCPSGISCQACSGCTAVPSSVPNKGCGGANPCYLNSALLSKIQAISGVSGWRVTESWPPTVQHSGVCHQNGTCADINNSGGATDPATIKRYYDAFRAAGLDVLYETNNCAPYTAVGITKCGTYPTMTNGSSFHVK